MAESLFPLLPRRVGSEIHLCPYQGDYVYRSFMHLVDLPFHEAGHLVFTFLGDFMHVLGGTLGQVIVPAVCAAAFLRQAEPFGASCCLWWTGQSFIDIAPYVYDARAGQLRLLGGVTGQDNPCFHDWHNILGRLGLLSYDHALAYAAKFTGVLLIVLSLFGVLSSFSDSTEAPERAPHPPDEPSLFSSPIFAILYPSTFVSCYDKGRNVVKHAAGIKRGSGSGRKACSSPTRRLT